MSISAAELVWRKSANNSDIGSNGGRMTAVAIPTNVKNNIWPDVPQSERVAGSTKYRKVFVHVANDDDLSLIQARVFIETNTPGDDSVVIFPGTFVDTQSSLTGSERVYGCGKLNADAALAATSVQVLTEGASLDYLKPGDLIRISDKTSVDAVPGNVQVATIAPGGVSYIGNVATLQLVDPLSYAFSAALTRVSSIINCGDVAGLVAGFVKTSVAGTFDTSNNPVRVDSIGGVEQSWTITFTGVNTFTCVGDTLGSMGTGNISGSFQPTNPSFSKPYFVIPAAAWGGTYAPGDSVVFTTHPAAIPVWYKRIIPPNAASLTGNKVIVGVDGESS